MQIGPYCVVGDGVHLADAVVLKSHVVVEGDTHIGEGTTVYPFATIGLVPQDLKFHGEQSRTRIGAHNTIREHVTIHAGTEGGGMETRMGDNCLLMVGCHVAHDCELGNHVIMANNATLAGHVTVGNFAIIGGLSAVHQFVRIGAHAMIGGMSGIEQDVIPYGSAMGERASLAGLNLLGLKRRGFSREDIHAIRHAYKAVFDTDDGTMEDRVQKLEAQGDVSEAVADVITFIRQNSARSVLRPKAVVTSPAPAAIQAVQAG